MSEFICLISERSGKIVRARKGDLDVQRGDLCLIESEFGGDLATVVDIASDICRHQKKAEDAPRSSARPPRTTGANSSGSRTRRDRLSISA